MSNVFIRTNIAPYRVDTYNALHDKLDMKMCFYTREGTAQRFDVDALENKCNFKPVYLDGNRSQLYRCCYTVGFPAVNIKL